MVYETLRKGLDYICQNTGKALATGALVVLPFVGPVACTPMQPRDTPVVQIDGRSFLDSYRKKAEAYSKDKVINPSEVPEILSDRKALQAFKEGLKGDDKVTAAMREEATAIEGTLNGYLSGLLNDTRLKASLIVIRQGHGPKDSVSISGANKGKEAHIAYNGTAADHIRDLGVRAEDIYRTMQPDSEWGYQTGDLSETFTRAEEGDKEAKRQVEKIKRDFATNTIEVVLADYGAIVPKFFPGSKEAEGKIVGGEIRAQDGTVMTVKKFQEELAEKKIRHVRVVYELEFKEGEKTEEEKLLEKVEEQLREKGELPPKPQPRPRPNKEEKKGRGFDNFGVDDD